MEWEDRPERWACPTSIAHAPRCAAGVVAARPDSDNEGKGRRREDWDSSSGVVSKYAAVNRLMAGREHDDWGGKGRDDWGGKGRGRDDWGGGRWDSAPIVIPVPLPVEPELCTGAVLVACCKLTPTLNAWPLCKAAGAELHHTAAGHWTDSYTTCKCPSEVYTLKSWWP